MAWQNTFAVVRLPLMLRHDVLMEIWAEEDTMHYLKRISRENGEEGVSPVVGVMLMLVVVIIIAAVVSGFAGGLMSGQAKSPTIAMDVQIKNTGVYASSVFEAKVVTVSEPIPTKDLKLVTTWTNSSGGKGGATVTKATNVFGWGGGGFPAAGGTAPWGYGPGVAASNSGKPNEAAQQFGVYTLIGGTSMYAYPAGQSGGFITSPGSTGYGVGNSMGQYTGWSYTAGTTVDGMQAVLGNNWESLVSGNVVNVKLVYIPSGATIFNKDVVVG